MQIPPFGAIFRTDKGSAKKCWHIVEIEFSEVTNWLLEQSCTASEMYAITGGLAACNTFYFKLVSLPLLESVLVCAIFLAVHFSLHCSSA